MRPRTKSAAMRVLAALALALALAPAAGAATPDIRHSPGYRPLVDPESASVRLGRRANAPRVKLPLAGGARSLDDIGRAACRAMRLGSPDTLLGLSVTEREFATILWREFPQSRPATGLTAADGWGVLQNRLIGGARQLAHDHAGRALEFVRWERRDTVAVYRNFRLHNGLTLVVRNEQGAEEKLDTIRSVVERHGRFKIYSTRD